MKVKKERKKERMERKGRGRKRKRTRKENKRKEKKKKKKRKKKRKKENLNVKKEKKKKEKKRKENSNERKKKKKESRFLSCRGREFIHEIHESSNRPKMVSNRNCVFKLACGSSARACGRTEWARMRQGRVRVCSSAYMRVKCVCVGL